VRGRTDAGRQFKKRGDWVWFVGTTALIENKVEKTRRNLRVGIAGQGMEIRPWGPEGGSGEGDCPRPCGTELKTEEGTWARVLHGIDLMVLREKGEENKKRSMEKKKKYWWRAKGIDPTWKGGHLGGIQHSLNRQQRREGFPLKYGEEKM